MSVLLRVNPDRRPSAEQILTIPSIRRYVQEYTSRSSRTTSSSRQSTTSVSETSSTAGGNQRDVKPDTGVSSHKGVSEGEDHVFESVENASKEPSTDVSCSATPCVDIESKQSVDISARGSECQSKAKEDRSFRGEPNICCNTSAREKRAKKVEDSFRKVDKNCRSKDKLRICSDSSVSRRSDNIKRKLPTASDNDNNVPSSKSSKNSEDQRVFSKEGIKTIKRRKYSCMTPVAPKIVQNIGTPQSMKSRKHVIGKEPEGTPPVVRLFGNRPQSKGVALNDGFSPDVSPRFRTRVLRKELAPKGNVSAKDHVPTEQQPKVRDLRKADQADVAQETPSNKVATNCKQDRVKTSNQCPLTSDHVHDEGDDDTASCGVNNMNVDVETASYQSQQDSVENLCRRQREVSDMLLACTPSVVESRTDIQAKMELLKMFLERKLGSDNAVLAYGIIAKGTAECKPSDAILGEVEDFLPSGNSVYTPLLIHVKCLEEWCMQSFVR